MRSDARSRPGIHRSTPRKGPLTRLPDFLDRTQSFGRMTTDSGSAPCVTIPTTGRREKIWRICESTCASMRISRMGLCRRASGCKKAPRSIDAGPPLHSTSSASAVHVGSRLPVRTYAVRVARAIAARHFAHVPAMRPPRQAPSSRPRGPSPHSLRSRRCSRAAGQDAPVHRGTLPAHGCRGRPGHDRARRCGARVVVLIGRPRTEHSEGRSAVPRRTQAFVPAVAA
jgi:hypothetical protein